MRLKRVLFNLALRSSDGGCRWDSPPTVTWRYHLALDYSNRSPATSFLIRIPLKSVVESLLRRASGCRMRCSDPCCSYCNDSLRLTRAIRSWFTAVYNLREQTGRLGSSLALTTFDWFRGLRRRNRLRAVAVRL